MREKFWKRIIQNKKNSQMTESKFLNYKRPSKIPQHFMAD